MKRIVLSLQYQKARQRTIEGWMIQSENSRAIVEEIASWHVSQRDLSFWFVPRSESDLKCAGVFVTGFNLSGIKPSILATPYGKIGKKFYLPIDADLFPTVSPEGLDSLIQVYHLCLFHPRFGFIGFEKSDEYSISQLIAFPMSSEQRWNRAKKGIHFARKVEKIELISPPPKTDIRSKSTKQSRDFSASKFEINRLKAMNEKHLKVLKEQQVEAKKEKRASKKIFTFGFRKKKNTPPNPVNSVRSWAGDQFNTAMNRVRHRELHKLVDLLENDPDEGLRYAIPLASGKHRGLAHPTAHLRTHDPTFKLELLNGGSPTDSWHIPADLRRQLVNQYRTIATSKTRQGNYREAAYVYAYLLGDINAAAYSLSKGEFYREAAILYKDTLKKPRSAAFCLEKAGLLTEAIPLYQNVGDFEKAAELCIRLERLEDSTYFYQKAVYQYQSRGNILDAAKILEAKLDDIPAALTILRSAWPASGQATRSLKEFFRITAERGLHEQSIKTVDELLKPDYSKHHAISLAQTFSSISRNYPFQPVREKIVDSAMILIATTLEDASAAEAEQLILALGKLVPEDYMLERDCFRYLKKRRQLTRSAISQKSGHSKRVQIKSSFNLDGAFHWVHVASVKDCFYALGNSADSISLVRVFWNGEIQHPPEGPWRLRKNNKVPILLSPAPQGQFPLYVCSADVPRALSRFEDRTFLMTDYCESSIVACSPPWLMDNILAMERTFHGYTWALARHEDLLKIYSFSPHGDIVYSKTIGMSDEENAARWIRNHLPLPFHARDNCAFFSFGNRLLILKQDQKVETIQFPGQIQGISGSPEFSRTRIFLAFEHGAAILRRHLNNFPHEMIAEDMENPRALFLKSGKLVIISHREWRLYELKHGQQRIIESGEINDIDPVGLCPTNRVNQWVLVYPQGKWVLFEHR